MAQCKSSLLWLASREMPIRILETILSFCSNLQKIFWVGFYLEWKLRHRSMYMYRTTCVGIKYSYSIINLFGDLWDKQRWLIWFVLLHKPRIEVCVCVCELSLVCSNICHWKKVASLTNFIKKESFERTLLTSVVVQLILFTKSWERMFEWLLENGWMIIGEVIIVYESENISFLNQTAFNYICSQQNLNN